LNLKKKYKVLISIGVALFLLFISYSYIKSYFIFTIIDNEQAIKESISKMVKQPIQINMVKDIDNMKIVLYSMGSDIGESEFVKGPNKKFKIDSGVYGPTKVMYRIVKTNKGQYVEILGKNDAKISKITVYIDDKEYNLTIPAGDYFITNVRLTKSTTSSFPTASIWYDKEHKEIVKSNIP
jgi:hypothetical protein